MSNFKDFFNSSPIKSIQRGETVGSATITIAEVDTTKTIVSSSYKTQKSTEASWSGIKEHWNTNDNYSAYAYGYGYGYGKVGGGIKIIDSTTIEILAESDDTTTYWEVIEYV